MIHCQGKQLYHFHFYFPSQWGSTLVGICSSSSKFFHFNLIALIKAKIVHNFGLSECNGYTILAFLSAIGLKAYPILEGLCCPGKQTEHNREAKQQSFRKQVTEDNSKIIFLNFQQKRVVTPHWNCVSKMVLMMVTTCVSMEKYGKLSLNHP